MFRTRGFNLKFGLFERVVQAVSVVVFAEDVAVGTQIGIAVLEGESGLVAVFRVEAHKCKRFGCLRFLSGVSDVDLECAAAVPFQFEEVILFSDDVGQESECAESVKCAVDGQRVEAVVVCIVGEIGVQGDLCAVKRQCAGVAGLGKCPVAVCFHAYCGVFAGTDAAVQVCFAQAEL